MASLTPKQKEILDFIESFIKNEGYSPSLKEIAEHFGKSIPTIFNYIESLKSKGFLQKESDVSRGIYLHKPEIFLLGRIAAGEPIEPLENPEPISVPDVLIRTPGNYYALEVKGNSMIEEGILDKDIIVVKHQLTADNGDIVVAITENGATLKVFRRKNDIVMLEPRNKKFKSIYPKQLEIRGKFMGLLRKE